MSSFVRRCYYDRFSRITRLPRVVVGTPYSWDPTISISAKKNYELCIWSPCGRSVAALIGNMVEIRNQLTFELLTTLQPTKTRPLLAGPLAYSPDGLSLACGSGTAILIWDIQTGGVAKEIVCSANAISLVWLLDGRTIGTLECPDSRHTRTHITTYDVASGAALFVETIDSSHKPHLWAYEETFRLMTMERYPLDRAKLQIQIKGFEAGSYLIRIHTFDIITDAQAEDASAGRTLGPSIASFSPTTLRVSVSVGSALFVFEDQEPRPLLQVQGHFLSLCFSSDGNLFAASKENKVHIWQYSSLGSYDRWRDFQCQDRTNSIQFSPTPFSILSHSGNILYMFHLENLPITSKRDGLLYAGLSRSGNRIATAHQFRTNISIMDPHSQSLSQLISTDLWLEGFLLTSNVLLAVGSAELAAWRLTEEGLVDGEFAGRSPDHGDCIWTIPFSSFGRELEFKVEGQVGMIKHDGKTFLYHTGTGEFLQSIQTPPRLSGQGHDPRGGLCGRHYLHYHGLSQRNSPPEGGWYPSETTLREGWVKDPEGRHRLWLHVEWRKSWDLADWYITTQFSLVGGQPVIIKF